MITPNPALNKTAVFAWSGTALASTPSFKCSPAVNALPGVVVGPRAQPFSEVYVDDGVNIKAASTPLLAGMLMTKEYCELGFSVIFTVGVKS